VRNLRVGDRVVAASSIACGACSYCRAGYFSQCDITNGAFFGGPKDSGGYHGLQAEYARIPYAHVGLIKLPDAIDDDRAILLSDVFPTGYFGAEIGEIDDGDTVAVFGCGPVGQFAIAGARLHGAGRIIAIDHLADRLEMARAQGAEVISFEEDDPVEVIKELTNDIGVDRAIDAVGVDAVRPHKGPAAKKAEKETPEFDQEVRKIAPKTNPEGRNWHPGDAPSLTMQWAVEALAKAGTLSIIGVYPQAVTTFPIGAAFGKNLTVQMGGCNHRAYIPRLIEYVMAGAVDPLQVLTRREPLRCVFDAYRGFDTRTPGWVKVELRPAV
jgi:threonine dehydrogenase-like Zn-dependent dehydrogenase